MKKKDPMKALRIHNCIGKNLMVMYIPFSELAG
jgi:hypothetical protein